LNLCRSCGEDFSSVRNFDRHRVGVHEYTYSQGAVMAPPREDGRRCLVVEELEGIGLSRDRLGRWSDPDAAAATREAFATVGE
jgi:hypothetical protein